MSHPRHFRMWLVRHPRPVVASGICYGVTDLPADTDDTTRCALGLAEALPEGSLVTVSGLSRAQSLASALHQLRPDLAPPKVDARINEMDFGQWEMCAWNDIDPADFDRWMKDFSHHRFGGRESVAEMLARVNEAMQASLQACRRLGPEVQSVWITHAGVIRAVDCLQNRRGRPLTPEDWPNQTIAFGRWTVIEAEL